MKDNQHVKPIINVENRTVTFLVKGLPDIVFEMDRAHADNNTRAALTGYAQTRIVDAAAMPMTDDEGNIIPEEERIQMKHDRMSAIVNHLHTGSAEWARKSEGGGMGSIKSITIEAIARVKGLDYEAAKAEIRKYAEKQFAGDTKKALAHLRKGSQVSKMILEIRAERIPAAKVDADEALKELGGR